MRRLWIGCAIAALIAVGVGFALSRALHVFKAHGDSVTAVAFSPDGRRLLSAGGDCFLRLWDLESGAEVRRLGDPAKMAPATAVVFLPDGRRVLSAHAGSFKPDKSHYKEENLARLWDLESGAEIRRFVGTEHDFGAGAIGIDVDLGGRVMVSLHWWERGEDRCLRFWNLETGALVRRIGLDRRDEVTAVALSPDGKVVALASSGEDIARVVDLIDVASEKTLRTLVGPTSRIHSVRFSSDGRRVVVASGGPKERFAGRLDGVGQYSFKVGDPGEDNLVRVYDAASGVCERTFAGHTYYLAAVAFSPDGTLVASGAGDWTARVWDSATGVERFRTSPAFYRAVLSVAFSPDGRTLAVGGETARGLTYGGLYLVDVATGKVLRKLEASELPKESHP